MLKSGRFTETDVKALLIDLREVAKYMRDRLSSETNEFTRKNKEFIEVCDFIAHASRDRGIIETNVRNHVQRLHAALETSTLEEFQNIPVENVINANALVLALGGLAFFCFSSTDKDISNEFVSPLIERQSEIALCILSLLQDSIIELKDEEGFAALQLYPYEGTYHVYCRVINSRIEREAKSRTDGQGRVILGFPVMVSAAKSLLSADDLGIEDSNFPFPIFETYRDEQGNLALRRLPV
ncbi:MAG: hypothetical protein WBK19_03260 [Azonexus sp.]